LPSRFLAINCIEREKLDGVGTSRGSPRPYYLQAGASHHEYVILGMFDGAHHVDDNSEEDR